MATIHIDEIFILGLVDEITSVKYEASFNEDYSNPFHEEEKDALDMFNSYFTVTDENGEIYFGNDPIYTRFNIKLGDDYIGWFEVSPTTNGEINALSDENKEALRKRLLEIKII